MSDDEAQPVRWLGAFRSEGPTELPEPLARDLGAMRNAAVRRCVLAIGGGLSLPLAFVALLVVSDQQAFFLPILISVFAGPIIAATALVKHGEVAWRYRSLPAGMTVERFAGYAPHGFEDTVTKRLRKRKLIEGERRHSLLVVPQSGLVLAVDDGASPHAVRGAIAETAPLRAEYELTRPVSNLERAELVGVMDRLHKLPVGQSVGLGWLATLILRVVFLRDPAKLAWFNEWGWTVWFGITGVLLTLAQRHAWLRIAALRGEFEGPLHVVKAEDQQGTRDAFAVAGFPQSGIIWQYGQHPGPARLEGGGLLSKAARKARG